MPYAVYGFKWPSETVTWSFADLDIPGDRFASTIQSESFRAEVRAAFARWDTVADIDFVEVADSASSSIRVGQAPLPSPGPDIVLSGNTAFTASSGNLLSSSIVFDFYKPETNNNYFPVALHEVGHALGLDHTGSASDIMYGSGVQVTDLSADDVAGAQVLYGPENDFGAGNDLVSGTPGNDVLHGFDGNDTVDGGRGNDVVFGDAGDDRLLGGLDDDEVRGWIGDDVLFGEDGNDLVLGEDGRDFVGAGAGNDFVSGGVGDDILFGEGGNDLLFGDAGSDRVTAGAGDDAAYGGLGDDVVFGEEGNDDVRGEEGNDFLGAGAGADVVSGGAGNDALFGEDGNDLLFGNSGNDELVGGAGSDTFRFGRFDGQDLIRDFIAGNGPDHDVIALNNGPASFADVVAASRQVGADVVISYGSGDTITLQNVQLSALTQDDFVFA